MTKKSVMQNEAFRRQTVELLETSGKSVSELARELGIGEKSLYRWRKQSILLLTRTGSALTPNVVAAARHRQYPT